MELTEFLRARFADDEAVARYTLQEQNRHSYHWSTPWDTFNPVRVLAECEAKRRIVEWLPERTVLRLLALPYADHPDYDEAWRP